ncbi:ASCC3 [Mytilus edulis]|uniref:ASCC3 n=1 Tax=Mytilus edulis TaxID=6550 RepID=A0A8S3V832_MYTED|nr:ASCC3 [Mytilus edulis]
MKPLSLRNSCFTFNSNEQWDMRFCTLIHFKENISINVDIMMRVTTNRWTKVSMVRTMCYYNLDDTDHDSINKFLSKLVERALYELECSYCIAVGEDNRTIDPQTLGRISSYYYLNHNTVRMFRDELKPESSIAELLDVLSNANEYDELPVRHNEDQLNSELAKKLPVEVNQYTYDSAHTKANLLLQAHFGHGQVGLPSTDYNTDTKSVLDQAIRILQAMLDVSADEGWLVTSLRIMQMVQMVIQGLWCHDNNLLTLPHMMPYHLACFRPWKGHGAKKKGYPDIKSPIETLPQLMAVCDGRFEALNAMLGEEMDRAHLEQIYQTISKLPQISVKLSIEGWWEGGTENRRNGLYIHLYQKVGGRGGTGEQEKQPIHSPLPEGWWEGGTGEKAYIHLLPGKLIIYRRLVEGGGTGEQEKQPIHSPLPGKNHLKKVGGREEQEKKEHSPLPEGWWEGGTGEKKQPIHSPLPGKVGLREEQEKRPIHSPLPEGWWEGGTGEKAYTFTLPGKLIIYRRLVEEEQENRRNSPYIHLYQVKKVGGREEQENRRNGLYIHLTRLTIYRRLGGREEQEKAAHIHSLPGKLIIYGRLVGGGTGEQEKRKQEKRPIHSPLPEGWWEEEEQENYLGETAIHSPLPEGWWEGRNRRKGSIHSPLPGVNYLKKVGGREEQEKSIGLVGGRNIHSPLPGWWEGGTGENRPIHSPLPGKLIIYRRLVGGGTGEQEKQPIHSPLPEGWWREGGRKEQVELSIEGWWEKQEKRPIHSTLPGKLIIYGRLGRRGTGEQEKQPIHSPLLEGWWEGGTGEKRLHTFTFTQVMNYLKKVAGGEEQPIHSPLPGWWEEEQEKRPWWEVGGGTGERRPSHSPLQKVGGREEQEEKRPGGREEEQEKRPIHSPLPGKLIIYEEGWWGGGTGELSRREEQPIHSPLPLIIYRRFLTRQGIIYRNRRTGLRPTFTFTQVLIIYIEGWWEGGTEKRPIHSPLPGNGLWEGGTFTQEKRLPGVNYLKKVGGREEHGEKGLVGGRNRRTEGREDRRKILSHRRLWEEEQEKRPIHSPLPGNYLWKVMEGALSKNLKVGEGENREKRPIHSPYFRLVGGRNRRNVASGEQEKRPTFTFYLKKVGRRNIIHPYQVEGWWRREEKQEKRKGSPYIHLYQVSTIYRRLVGGRTGEQEKQPIHSPLPEGWWEEQERKLSGETGEKAYTSPLPEGWWREEQENKKQPIHSLYQKVGGREEQEKRPIHSPLPGKLIIKEGWWEGGTGEKAFHLYQKVGGREEQEKRQENRREQEKRPIHSPLPGKLIIYRRLVEGGTGEQEKQPSYIHLYQVGGRNRRKKENIHLYQVVNYLWKPWWEGGTYIHSPLPEGWMEGGTGEQEKRPIHSPLPEGWWEGGTGEQEKQPIHSPLPGAKIQDDNWMEVHADQEYVLRVNMDRINKIKKHDSKAFAPRFPKPKDEGWFLLVGDIENKEVVALKRVGYIRGRSSQQIAIIMPDIVGRVIYTVYMMSDSYLGLDQQYDICLDVIPASIESQVNTELVGELDFGDLQL